MKTFSELFGTTRSFLRASLSCVGFEHLASNFIPVISFSFVLAHILFQVNLGVAFVVVSICAFLYFMSVFVSRLSFSLVLIVVSCIWFLYSTPHHSRMHAGNCHPLDDICRIVRAVHLW